jgi:glutamate-1-semialdehyde 2,1-aminomutase
MIEQRVRDRRHQVGFAEPRTPVDEQWIVVVSRLGRDGAGRGLRELIRCADDERVERVPWVERRADRHGPAHRARGNEAREQLPLLAGRHFEHDLARTHDCGHGVLQTRQEVVVHAHEHQSVRHLDDHLRRCDGAQPQAAQDVARGMLGRLYHHPRQHIAPEALESGRRSGAMGGVHEGGRLCRRSRARRSSELRRKRRACSRPGSFMATESERLFQQASGVIPGGVNSPVRSWRAVGGHPVFIARGEGPYVFDADGRRYVDFDASWGPLILGHAPPPVVDAIGRQAAQGTTFGAPTALEVELASLLVEALPSVEQVRLVSSGTEATMSALRLARAATRRNHILKFAGCYHGHVDALLVRAGSGALTLGVPDSPGVPTALADLTTIAALNDVDGTRVVIRKLGSELAAVIVEPVPANMGVVPAEPGFLEMLREETSRVGALLVFDEVVTGFRVGWSGAQGRFGITPDLTCLGKIIGGGMPLAAFGGRRDLMAMVAPAGPVYQAGTLSGNPVSVAAGLAALRALRDHPRAYERLEELGALAERRLRAALGESGRRGTVNRVGSMLTLFLGPDRVRSYEDAVQSDTDRFGRYFRAMLEQNVYLPPSQFEAMFLSLAHDEEHVEALGRAAARALRAA